MNPRSTGTRYLSRGGYIKIQLKAVQPECTAAVNAISIASIMEFNTVFQEKQAAQR
jgi:uncharacterized membrane protein